MAAPGSYAMDTVTAFLAPPLPQDLGTSSFESHYDKFKQDVAKELLPFFRFLQNNRQLLVSTQEDTLEFRKHFLLFLCEQTAPQTLYQIEELHLMANIENQLHENINECLNNDPILESDIFDYYCIQLKAENWKRNLGSAHGFEQFLLYRFLERNKKMDSRWTKLALSAGLLFNDFYDPNYKEMGYRLFIIVMDKGVKAFISEMNIQDVVYEIAFKDIDTFESEMGIELVWTCLLKHFNFSDDSLSLRWNRMDDLTEALFRRIALTSSFNVLVILLSFIFKISARVELGESPTKLILGYSTDTIDFKNNIGVIREIAVSCRTTTVFRWAKNVLDMFIAQSNYLLADPRDCEVLLLNMHLCYLICVFPLPMYAVEPHLINFFEKFPSVLMEVLDLNKGAYRIKMSVKLFLETLSKHLDKGELAEFRQAFEKILKFLDD